MRSHERHGGLRRLTPVIAILGVVSLSACRSDSDPDRDVKASVGPSFDCTRANFFQATGTDGYVRAEAVRDGKPVALDSITISVPGMEYEETFDFNGDGVALIDRARPIPRIAGEITLRGVLDGESDLCTTDYEPFRELYQPEAEEYTER